MRPRLLVVTSAVLLVAGLLLVLLMRTPPTALEGSISDLRDNGSFSTSAHAGATLARISQRLLQDGRSCARSAPAAGQPTCDRRLAVAGWSSVAAVTTLRCTQPGTQQIRRDLLAHLEALRRGGSPDLPRLPDC